MAVKGILATVGETEFNRLIPGTGTSEISGDAQNSHLLKVDNNVSPSGDTGTVQDWISGDRGYIRGGGTGLNAGEWIINVGGDQFWGFAPPDWTRQQSLSAWISKVKDFSNGVAQETGQRWYPGVGLE